MPKRRNSEASAIPFLGFPNLMNERARYVQFRIKGVTGIKQAVIVPDTCAVGTAHSAEIMQLFGLSPPNMCIRALGGQTHMGHLLDDQLSEVFKKQLGSTHDDSKPARETEGGENQRLLSTKSGSGTLLTGSAATKIMKRRLLNLSSHMMDAVQQTNSWFVCRAPNLTALTLAEVCAQRSGTPVFVASDHLNRDRYQKYGASVEMTTALLAGSIPVDHIGRAERKVTVLNSDLYDNKSPFWQSYFSKTKDHTPALEEFKELGMDYWTFTHPWEGGGIGHPIFAWPFQHATHYIFFVGADMLNCYDTEGDGKCMPVCKWPDWQHPTCDWSAFGPDGNIFMCEDGKGAINEILEQSVPLILVSDTGMSCRQFGLLVEICNDILLNRTAVLEEKKILPHGSSEMDLQKRLKVADPQKLLSMILGQYSMKRLGPAWLSPDAAAEMELDLADVIGMLDIVSMRPKVFQDVVKSVSMFSSSAEIVDQLSASFTSVYAGVVDLSSIQKDRDTVQCAWKMHRCFREKGKKLWMQLVLLNTVSAILSFLTTALAIIVAQAPRYTQIMTGFGLGELSENAGFVRNGGKMAVIVLPTVVSLVQSVSMLLKVEDKHALVQDASAQLMREIWLFRAQVYPYDGHVQVDSDDSDDDGRDEDMGGKVLRQMRARQEFSRRLQSITSGAMGQEMLEENVNMISNFEGDALTEYVVHDIYGREKDGQATCCCCCRQRRAEQIDPEFSAIDEARYDGGLSHIGSEEYMQIRAARLLLHFQTQLPVLAARLRLFQFLVLVFGFASSVIAAFGFEEWVPMTVALTSMVSILYTVGRLKPRVVALNRGMRDIVNLQTQWASLSVVERRTPAVKLMLLTIVEEAAFSMQTSSSSMTETGAKQQGLAGISKDEDKKKKKEKNDKKVDIKVAEPQEVCIAPAAKPAERWSEPDAEPAYQPLGAEPRKGSGPGPEAPHSRSEGSLHAMLRLAQRCRGGGR